MRSRILSPCLRRFARKKIKYATVNIPTATRFFDQTGLQQQSILKSCHIEVEDSTDRKRLGPGVLVAVQLQQVGSGSLEGAFLAPEEFFAAVGATVNLMNRYNLVEKAHLKEAK